MKLVVIGGGEHARVVIEAAQSRPETWNVIGFVDVQPNPETEDRLGVRRLGGDLEGRSLVAPDVRFVIGIAALGSHQARMRIVTSYEEAGARWATVVHASAWLSPTAQLSDGVFVSAGVIINTGARIGFHAVINTGAIVEHDVVIGSFSHLAPGAVIGGGTKIGDGAYVGLGARVRDHIEVGESVTVGMGAVVIGSVSSDLVVIGNPTRVKGR